MLSVEIEWLVCLELRRGWIGRVVGYVLFFFFSSRRRHTRFDCDWSSDVCSSDLGGAKVVGFDIVLPTSIEQSAVPFGDTTLGERVRGFDRDYLRALALGARAGKVVLGQVQHQDRPLLPSPGQRAAVGFGRNIRALNVHSDADDVIRRVPMRFD